MTSEVVSAWHARARANPRRIVLADNDERSHAAAERLTAEGLADAFVLDDETSSLSTRAAEISDDLGDKFDVTDPLHLAALMVRAGDAAGAVGGATRPTADVIRAGLRVMGVAPEVNVVSSCFLMVLADGRPVVYADCGILADPTAPELADVAVAGARTFEQLTEQKPHVAMLSFSTKSSASHPRIDKGIEATELVRKQAPNLVVDGELQFDAAFLPEVGSVKAPDSLVAGRANVFVFPDLDSGNIAYKITERLGGASAYGPLVQGLNGVLHDLSRGCSVDDIVNVAVIAGIQASDSGGE